MNAPLIWILFPGALAFILLFLPRQRRYDLAAALSLLLAALTKILPIETVAQLGSWQFKLADTLFFFGRELSLQNSHLPILFFYYLLLGLWLLDARFLQADRFFPSLALLTQSLLLAALTIHPVIYAAPLLTFTALMMALFFSRYTTSASHRALLRFVALHVIALPLLLLAGWLMTGVESAPADTALVAQAGLLLLLGMLILLPAFPFQIWLPTLAEDLPPYLLSFWLFIFPSSVFFFLLTLNEHYLWLREAPFFLSFLRQIGLITLASGGLLAAYPRNASRTLSYFAIALNGITLLALSLPGGNGMQAAFILFLPRGLAFLLGGSSLTRLGWPHLHLRALKGLVRKKPYISAAALTVFFVLAGLPLFVNFPIYYAIWRALAQDLLWQALIFGFSLLGLTIGALRLLAVLTMSDEDTPWDFRQPWHTILWLNGLSLMLVLLAIFPQWTQTLLNAAARILPHLTG